jgi:hypothetical protein
VYPDGVFVGSYFQYGIAKNFVGFHISIEKKGVKVGILQKIMEYRPDGVIAEAFIIILY